MSPFANPYGASNGPTLPGRPGGQLTGGSGARPGPHGPSRYGQAHGYRDAEYEFEQQRRDREHERERERESQRREEAELPPTQAPHPLPHHAQQTGSGGTIPPEPGGVMMIQPPYYGIPPDTRDSGEIHGYPHNVPAETSGQRDGREVLEGRDRDAKDLRDAREAHDMREEGRRSISPVNVGGPSNQSWTEHGVWYGGRNEGRSEAMDVDDEERLLKERERRERERNE